MPYQSQKLLILSMGAALCLPMANITHAQEGLDLEAYLAAEDSVPESQSPAPQPTEALPAQTPQDVTSTDNVISTQAGVATNQGTGDALPPVTNTRIRIETEGFNYTADKNVNAEFSLGGQDPEKQSQQELAEEIRREAFDAAITGLFPLSPANIKSLLKEYDKTQRAVEEPVYGIPTPRVNVETVSLDPGVAPMTIHTATGHITTLNILDVTGAPWPIQDISWAGDFEIIEPEEGGHVIRITPMAVSAYGNMSIRLLTLKTPVTIMLKTGTDNSTIMSVLDGVPPERATRLDVSGGDGRTTAFKIGRTTYVRTPLTLLSPGWDQSVSSADGMNVYALADTPVLLLSDRGRFMRAGLSPGKDLFDE